MNDSLTIAIEGAECLARLVDRRGKFLYRYDADNPGPSTGYNILRHCGTIWAMTEVANRAGPLPDVAQAAQRAAEWLIERHIRPYGATGTRCVVAGDAVKLGGNGLAILALLEVAALTGNHGPISNSPGIWRDTSFCSGSPTAISPTSAASRRMKSMPFHSDYYTGEALFGLLRLTAVTGDQRWLDVAPSQRRAACGAGLWRAPAKPLDAVCAGAAAQAAAAAASAAPCPSHRGRHSGQAGIPRITSAARRSPADRRACWRSCGCARTLSSDAADRPIFDQAAARARDRYSRESRATDSAIADPTAASSMAAATAKCRIDYIQHNISSFLGYSRLAGRKAARRSISTPSAAAAVADPPSSAACRASRARLQAIP